MCQYLNQGMLDSILSWFPFWVKRGGGDWDTHIMDKQVQYQGAGY